MFRKQQLFEQHLATEEHLEKAKKDVTDAEAQVKRYEKLIVEISR